MMFNSVSLMNFICQESPSLVEPHKTSIFKCAATDLEMSDWVREIAALRGKRKPGKIQGLADSNECNNIKAWHM